MKFEACIIIAMDEVNAPDRDSVLCAINEVLKHIKIKPQMRMKLRENGLGVGEKYNTFQVNFFAETRGGFWKDPCLGPSSINITGPIKWGPIVEEDSQAQNVSHYLTYWLTESPFELEAFKMQLKEIH